MMRTLVGNFGSQVRNIFHRAGYDIRRLHSEWNPTFRLVKALKQFDVDLVLDVGANVGQFSSGLRLFGYHGSIVSFEPLSVAHHALSNLARRDLNWSVHPRGAIGDRDAEIEIHIAGNSVSSSLLPMMDAHSSAAKGSAYIGAEKTPISRLDSVGQAYLAKTKRPFLKIDTQGYEWQVLDGARQTLPAVCGILCELSLVPLYEGQRLWLDIIQRLEGDGFSLWSIENGFTDPRDGRVLQVDAIFFRE